LVLQAERNHGFASTIVFVKFFYKSIKIQYFTWNSSALSALRLLSRPGHVGRPVQVRWHEFRCVSGRCRSKSSVGLRSNDPESDFASGLEGFELAFEWSKVF
jgi:hypothetical protein